jgi:DNA-binding PadR family transcriptional regulator
LVEQVDALERSEVAGATSRRSRIVYALTAEGKEAFGAWVADIGPDAWEDEAFAARMAFFSRTDAAVRLRILEGRRARMEERMRALEKALQHTSDRMDLYAQRLQQHSVEGAAREVTWLEELIATEDSTRAQRREAKRERTTKGRNAR